MLVVSYEELEMLLTWKLNLLTRVKNNYWPLKILPMSLHLPSQLAGGPAKTHIDTQCNDMDLFCK